MLPLLHFGSKIGYLTAGIIYPVYCTYSLVASSNIEWTQFSQLRKLQHLQQQQKDDDDDDDDDESPLNAVIKVDPERMQMWLSYWMCFSLILLFDYFFGVIFSVSFTFYDECRLLLILFLLLPKTKGATLLYNKFFAPPLKHNERFVDQKMASVSKQLYARVLQYIVVAKDKGKQFLTDQIQKYFLDPENSLVRSLTNSVDEQTKSLQADQNSESDDENKNK